MASAIRFYRATLEFQAEVAGRSSSVLERAKPLREQIDLSAVCSEMKSLLSIAERFGPEPLRAEAREWRRSGAGRWRQAGVLALEPGSPEITGPDDFFTRACLQPIAENLQRQISDEAGPTRNSCPACDGLPQMAVLRPEGEGSSRWLLCSFCLREWLFRRVICPSCGNEDKERLPRFTPGDWNYVYIEACDACRHYVKAVDMGIDGLSVPLVDEAALSVLDVWAAERGYTKIKPNLLGF